MPRIIGVSGNITAPSRTFSLVDAVVSKASQKFHSPGEIIDISTLTADLGPTVSFNNFPPALSQAYEKLHLSDLIVIGTPVYKASYTGLLKHFFDLVDPKKLTGKVAILVATGGSDHHALVLESHLRSLASFFGIYTIPTTIYAKDIEFKDYQLESPLIEQRIEQALEQASVLIKQHLPETLVA
jgi:FMN reductase